MFTIIGADGKAYGPVTAEQVRQWMAENRLNRDMKVRREGTAEWLRIGDLPEFAAPVPPPAPPAATPPSAPAGAENSGATGVAYAGAPVQPTASAAATPAAPERIVFTGEWSEYFRIWIINVLLTIVTLGIYAAWAKVRRRRYFCANTKLFGHAFEYLAEPKKILLGNLIVVALFLLLTFSQVVSPLLYAALAVLFAVAVPWFIVRALSFNARNTAWRGLRFNFTGTYGPAARVFLLWPLLVPFTLGLIFPFIAKRQKDFVVNHHAFGTSPFSFSGRTEDFYRIYGIAALFFLPLVALYFVMVAVAIAAVAARQGGQPPPLALGMISLLFIGAVPLAIAGAMYFRARMFAYVWNHTSIAGHRFVAAMRARDLFVLHFVNTLVTALTAGLLHPWAAVRTVKFQLDRLQVIPAGNVDGFVAAAQPPVGALGEAANDFFDFDLGFGV